jgi:hypothetical protein
VCSEAERFEPRTSCTFLRNEYAGIGPRVKEEQNVCISAAATVTVAREMVLKLIYEHKMSSFERVSMENVILLYITFYA